MAITTNGYRTVFRPRYTRHNVGIKPRGIPWWETRPSLFLVPDARAAVVGEEVRTVAVEAEDRTGIVVKEGR